MKEEQTLKESGGTGTPWLSLEKELRKRRHLESGLFPARKSLDLLTDVTPEYMYTLFYRCARRVTSLASQKHSAHSS